MRIINCFPYFNERELLELRIKLLSDKVDLFIITDANRTHKGDFKPFTCNATLQDLGLLSEKIQVIEIDLPDNHIAPDAWTRERIQRNAAGKLIENDDVCFVTDCDEIIDPKYIDYYVNVAKQYPNNILRMPMAFLMGRGDLRAYNLDNNPIPWTCPYVCMKHHLSEYTLSDIRESSAWKTNHIKYGDIFTTQNGVMDEVGWHFSWMGDIERLKIKNQSFAHWDEVVVQENYTATENSTDPLGRTDHILKRYPHDQLPYEIFSNEHIKKFLLKPSISVVQLGTNRAHDSLSDFLNKNYDELDLAIFVEPISMFNDDILKCYKKYKNVIIENIAIVDNKSGTDSIELFYHTGDEFLETASIYHNHLEKHTQYYKSGEVKSVTVPNMTLNLLLDKYNIINLDLLYIDIEGADFEVIQSIDWSKYSIHKIEFEYIHITQTPEFVKNFFKELGYVEVQSTHQFNWCFQKNN